MSGGGVKNKREHPKILIKYVHVAVHLTDVSENYSSSGMQIHTYHIQKDKIKYFQNRLHHKTYCSNLQNWLHCDSIVTTLYTTNKNGKSARA